MAVKPTAKPTVYKPPVISLPKPVAPKAPVKAPAYTPTNPGWGNAATTAKLAKLNPSGVSFLGPMAPMEAPPPTAAAPSQPSGGGGSGYWGYDFSGLEAQSAEDINAAKIGVGSRIKQALIDLGLGDISGLSEGVRGYLDDATVQAAKDNKYSVFAQAATKLRKQTAADRARMAGRGMLSSGATSVAAQNATEEAEAARYVGTREFSGQAQQALEGFATMQRQWAQRIAEARMQAAAAGYGGGSGGGGGGGSSAPYLGTGVGRPGEWADLPVLEGWEPQRNTDARYDMSGATKVAGGYIGPQGQRYDENGRVI